MGKAAKIDRYFRAQNFYPWIPYRSIGRTLVQERGGLWVSTAAALVEKESGGKNLFGCDWGGTWITVPPYCQVAVTRRRVQALLANIEDGGGQNGVGLTQLTALEYVLAAEREGGAHLPRYQMRVGFRLLNELIGELGFQAGAAAYNAGRGNWQSVYHTYGADVVRLQQEWQRRLE